MRKMILSVMALAVGLFGQESSAVRVSTQASRLEPKVAKPGTVLTIIGAQLGRNRVEEVYLTDHKFDMKVKVLEQTDGSLKIRVPPFAKPGRQQLLLLTPGENGSYLEMPVYVTIEVDEVAEVALPQQKAGVPSAPGSANQQDK